MPLSRDATSCARPDCYSSTPLQIESLEVFDFISDLSEWVASVLEYK